MSVSLTNIARWTIQNFFSKTQLAAGSLDSRYYAESEFIATSAGAGDAGKPIKLDAAGHVDATMINDADIDHGSIGGLTDDDHTGYARLAGRGAGQTLNGSVDAGGVLAIVSTSNATRGKVLFGDAQLSAYDEVNERWGFGTSTPLSHIHITSATTGGTDIRLANSDTGGKTYILRSSGSASTGGAGFLQLIENTSGNRLVYDGPNNRLGLNVLAPTVTLDILGNALITGDLTVTGTITGTTTGLATHESDTSTHGVAVAIVGTTDTQTLTNKTLTSPIISTISNTGTLTLPTSTDTLVGRNTTDTLTNKTLTTPTIGSFVNATHTHASSAQGGGINHNDLNGMSIGDGHSQYLLLAGRASGQTVKGGTAANEDLTLRGTNHATKTSSYVIIQPDGGNTVVGGSDTDYNFEIQNRVADDYRLAFRLNNSGINDFYSFNAAPGGAGTLAPFRINATNTSIVGQVNFATSSVPASITASGTAGNFAWEWTGSTGYLYFCFATNVWRRSVAFTTF